MFSFKYELANLYILLCDLHLNVFFYYISTSNTYYNTQNIVKILSKYNKALVFVWTNIIINIFLCLLKKVYDNGK